MARLSEVTGPPLSDSPKSTWERFADTVRSHPGSLAIVSLHQPPDLYGIPSLPVPDSTGLTQATYLRWTYKSLWEGVARLRAGLKAAGAKPGIPVFSFQPNGVEYVLSLWAAAGLGCVFEPISPQNLKNTDEVAHMVQTALATCPGKKPVVVAADSATASAITELRVWEASIKVVVAWSEPLEGWLPFDDLMKPTEAEETGPHQETTPGSAVLFTSGTTSLPKGIFSDATTHAMFVESWADSRPREGVYAGSRLCCILPNSHSFAHYMVVSALCVGAAVVYPSAEFEPQTMLRACSLEKVTQYVTYNQKAAGGTVVIPTIIHAISAANSDSSAPPLQLHQVIVGGAVLSPELRSSCMRELGTKHVENWYGMTEGLVVRPGRLGDEQDVVEGNEVSIGWVMPGYQLRIADPSTNRPVPLGALGELQGSSDIIRQYLHGVGAESFYQDPDGTTWFKTGDQAKMDVAGRVFITGRYKDIIIRAGVNISPAAIESAITRDPTLAGLDPQVVGMPDDVAGEVPVVVVLGDTSIEAAKKIQDAVIQHLGKDYVLDEVISAQSLGLSEYPRTTAGKVQKTKLAELARALRQSRQISTPGTRNVDSPAAVKEAWAAAMGLEPSHFAMDRPLAEFADSITILRVRATLQRQTGKSLPLREMLEAGTIQDHIDLLENRPNVASSVAHPRPRREGPPGVDDMVHLASAPHLFEMTKGVINSTIKAHGLEWDDVEDVTPVYDYYKVMRDTGTFDTWKLHYGILTEKTSTSEVRKALEVALSNNGILTSFIVSDQSRLESDIALYVMMRQNQKLFDIVIHQGPDVAVVADVVSLTQDYPHPEHATFPGPLARATMHRVEETGTIAIVLLISHAAADATSAEIFRSDLDAVLGPGGVVPAEHVDFKTYSDAYYRLRSSPAAEDAAAWHARRLAGMEAHARAGLEGPFPVPSDVAAARSAGGRDRARLPFQLAGLDKARAERRDGAGAAPAPHILLKAAFSLVQTRRTGHTHALFQSFEAARTGFSFLEESDDDGPPGSDLDAGDVAGPTTQGIINLVRVDPEQTVSAFLAELQDEQLQLTRYASAPLLEVMEKLGPAGELVPEVLRHHGFNWLPLPLMGGVRGNSYRNMTMVHFAMKPYLGFTLMGGLGGPDSDFVMMSGVGQMLDTEGIQGYLQQVEKVVLWLVDPEHWDSPVGGFASRLAD
ncbi:acetyl-CoA synthetase-like protein [Colletotrichum zoysiae]|uniref:Acetyl-CoA synthetase-like protein n=1 Tax=Colletotrichum zoysiae TaxID=1216348 RepID=A0AAD9M024_9PEZI|nr:acetyl-CoA synthetase-like protein [Colletotrichum zoysiae]